MEPSFICPRCGNKDAKYIALKNGKPYCRKCISFCGEEAEDKPIPPKEAVVDIPYSLSKEQKELSDRILSNFINGIDTLVYAVCGSGKTEISFQVLGYAMSRGLKVGFALPRRDVAIELYFRLKNAFPKNKISCIYGGHHDVLTGDCLVLTTHQLYRYPNYFDLLVMDEIDAFPFKDNDVLIALFRHSLRGHCVMMSATPSKEIVNSFQGEGKDRISLHTRYHGKPIPVPKILVRPGMTKFVQLIAELREFQRKNKPVFVFVPTVQDSKSLYDKISLIVKKGNYVSSKREGRGRIIDGMRKGVYSYLITTAVLERGVTIKDLQVIVFGSDNSIYNAATLVQIAGRAGRKIGATDGEVLFIADKISQSMEKAIREIKYCNTFL